MDTTSDNLMDYVEEVRKALEPLRNYPAMGDDRPGRFDMTGNRDHSELQRRQARFNNQQILFAGLNNIPYNSTRYHPLVFFWKGSIWAGFVDTYETPAQYVPVVDADGGDSTAYIIARVARAMNQND